MVNYLRTWIPHPNSTFTIRLPPKTQKPIHSFISATNKVSSWFFFNIISSEQQEWFFCYHMCVYVCHEWVRDRILWTNFNSCCRKYYLFYIFHFLLTSIGGCCCCCCLSFVCLGFVWTWNIANYGSMNLNVKCMSYVIYRKKRIIDLPSSSSSSPSCINSVCCCKSYFFFILPPLTLFLLSQHQIQLWATHIPNNPLYHISVYA